MSEVKHVKVCVLCSNADGAPEFFWCEVPCSEREYNAGQHYEKAKSVADEKGYELPMIAFDAADPAGQELAQAQAFLKAAGDPDPGEALIGKADESPKSSKSIRVVVAARGDGAPAYAYFDIGQDKIDLVERMARLCQENGLSEIRRVDSPVWGPSGYRLDLQLGEMVVLSDGTFWFTDHDRDDNIIETSGMSIADLRSLFDAAGDGSVVFEQSWLKDLYESDDDEDQEAPSLRGGC